MPAAGLEWLAFLRPSALEKRGDLWNPLSKLFPATRLHAFREVTGVDLLKVRAGAIAGFAGGTLYLAELGEPHAHLVRERFAVRLDDGGLLRRPQPNVHRLFGTRQSRPSALLSVDEDFVALATDDTALVRIVESYSAHKLRSPTALHGAALGSLPALPDDALAAFYLPGPFQDEWARAGGGALADATAAALFVRPGPPGTFALTVTLSGQFAPNQAARGEALGKALDDLRGSSTGHLIGLASVGTPKIVADLHHLTLTADLPVQPLADGLYAATSGNVHEIFDLVPNPTTGEPAVTP